MYCGACGQSLRNGVQFCTNCGAACDGGNAPDTTEGRLFSSWGEATPVPRLWRLRTRTEHIPALSWQVQDLVRMVYSLTQEVWVLQAMLEEQRLWDDSRYRELRWQRMVQDHSSAGPAPWERYSPYPHILTEHELLQWLGCDEGDLQRFDDEVDLAQSAT